MIMNTIHFAIYKDSTAYNTNPKQESIFMQIQMCVQKSMPYQMLSGNLYNHLSEGTHREQVHKLTLWEGCDLDHLIVGLNLKPNGGG